MKIIVSHDVDHLFPSDHFIKDTYFLKLWVLTIISLVKGRISLTTAKNRFLSIFDKKINNILEIMEFDKKNQIPSVFFFGMANCLGMSYKKESAIPYIKYLVNNGFDVGVHGVDYIDLAKMNDEFQNFKIISHINEFGIRMHYLRYDQNTLAKLSSIGYIFDSTEYNNGNIDKTPHKILGMWEFPLYIMDSHVMINGFENAKSSTIELLNRAKILNIKYFTFLFHDCYYNDHKYPLHKKYYEWFVNHCISFNFEFASYRSAIETLESSYSFK